MANICEGILVFRGGDLQKIMDIWPNNVTYIEEIYKKVGITEPPEDCRCSVELIKRQEDGSLILYTDSPWDSFTSVWDRLADAVGATYNGAFFNGEAYWIEYQNEFIVQDFPERYTVCVDCSRSFEKTKEAGEEILTSPDVDCCGGRVPEHHRHLSRAHKGRCHHA